MQACIHVTIIIDKGIMNLEGGQDFEAGKSNIDTVFKIKFSKTFKGINGKIFSSASMINIYMLYSEKAVEAQIRQEAGGKFVDMRV